MQNLKFLVFLLLIFGYVNSNCLAQESYIDAIPYSLNTWDLESDHSIQDTKISITAVKGTDLYISPDGNTTIVNAPKIYFETSSDFSFSAKVFGDFLSSYDGGALFVYQDSTHWAKLLFEQFDSGKNGIGTLVTKTVSDDAHHDVFDQNSVYLRIIKSGTVFSFSWSENNLEWQSVRNFSLPYSDSFKVGFLSQSPIGQQLSVEFSDIKFSEK